MGAVYPDQAASDTEGSSNKQVLGADDIDRSLTRISFEIIERNHGDQNLVIAGIPTRGATLARRIQQKIAQLAAFTPDLAIVDTTMYRDDLADHPFRAPHPSSIPEGGVDGRVVVLVDDVLFTGRTIKAALDAISQIGRPHTVQLAVLVDRGHRELPIRPDFVGKNLPTSRLENVSILLKENDGRDAVVLGRRA